jgi:hypothetical protein
MSHPDYILPPEDAGSVPAIEPVYPMTAGLAPKLLAKSIRAALDRAPALPEWLDPLLVEREGWNDWATALRAAHAPIQGPDLDPASAPRRRLAFDELLANPLALGLVRAFDLVVNALLTTGRVVRPAVMCKELLRLAMDSAEQIGGAHDEPPGSLRPTLLAAARGAGHLSVGSARRTQGGNVNSPLADTADWRRSTNPDWRYSAAASGPLRVFNDAGALETADVLVAQRLTELAGETDERVALAIGFVVRAIRGGSVCLDLATVAGQVGMPELPWPEPADWLAAVTASALVTGPAVLHLDGGLLYLDRYWIEECRVAADVRRLAATARTGPAVDVHRLFPDTFTEQRGAAALALSRALTVLTVGERVVETPYMDWLKVLTCAVEKLCSVLIAIVWAVLVLTTVERVVLTPS